jgi:hypothetical protein
MTARRVAVGIEFVFKWFGLILMMALMVAIVATDPPKIPAASGVPPATMGAR